MMYTFYNELISDRNIISLQEARETHLKVLMFNQLTSVILSKKYDNEEHAIHDYFTCIRLGLDIGSTELHFTMIKIITFIKHILCDCHSETFYKYYEQLSSDIDRLISQETDTIKLYNLKEYKMKLSVNFRQQQINLLNRRKED